MKNSSDASGSVDWVSLVDDNLIKSLAAKVIETPSPTGHEGDMARMLGEAMRSLSLDVSYQPIYDDRINVVGSWSGSQPGPTILLSGHMDTSVSGDEEWLHGSGWKNVATFEDGWVYGNGIFNMKGAFVSYLAMIDALQKAKFDLRGRIVVAGVVGEIELSPVDEFHGKEYDSYGVGMRFLLNHGVAADYHILGEPSALTPLTGMMGTVWVKMTTHGDFVHTAFSGEHQDAILNGENLWRALRGWREKFVDEFSVSSVRAKINRAAVRGGLPWRAARTAAQYNQYLDVRFNPAIPPIDIQREISEGVRNAADSIGLSSVDVQFYMSRPGTRIPSCHPLVSTIAASHEDVTGEKANVQFAPPLCTDAIDANRLGIPTVVYGPAGRAASGQRDISRDPRAAQGEGVRLDDLKLAAAVYAETVRRLTAKSMEEMYAERLPMPSVSAE